MELQTLLLFVAVLACPIGMGLMMWMMNKNMSGEHGHSMPGNQTTAERLATLRAQRQALEAEIAEAAKIAELESKREALALRSAQKPASDDDAAAQSAN